MDVFEGEGAPDARMEAVRFVGSTLSQFFLNDPSSGAIDAGIEAMAALDADAAAAEWPFVEETEARRCLTLMHEGALQREADGGEALKWEYRRLFVGPQSLPVPPWGSVYTDRDCVVFGESTVALRAWMRSHGIERLNDERDPEGRISVWCSPWLLGSPERSPNLWASSFGCTCCHGRGICLRSSRKPPTIRSTRVLRP